MSKSLTEIRREFEDDFLDCDKNDLRNLGMIDKQIGGDHYSKHQIQPWDIIDEYSLDYYLGNVIKYVLRDKYNHKEDLQKAIHYLEKRIELLEQRDANQ